jgi:hypothetical protein
LIQPKEWCHLLAACPITSLCWREPDSNLYGAFPVKWCFWFVGGSLSGAVKPFFVPSPAIRFAERRQSISRSPPGDLQWWQYAISDTGQR